MILVLLPSVGGFSGAPVFDTRLSYASGDGGQVLLAQDAESEIVGVVHGTASDDTGGKLGLVTPAHLLLELIRSINGR